MSGNTATLPSPGLPLMTHGPPQHLKRLAATPSRLHVAHPRFSIFHFHPRPLPPTLPTRVGLAQPNHGTFPTQNQSKTIDAINLTCVLNGCDTGRTDACDESPHWGLWAAWFVNVEEQLIPVHRTASATAFLVDQIVFRAFLFLWTATFLSLSIGANGCGDLT